MPRDFDDGYIRNPDPALLTTIIAAMDALSDPFAADKGNPLKPDQINLDIPTVVPKGCREYWFNAAGEPHCMKGDTYQPFRILRSEVVFKCIASNEKNAIRKFKNRKV